MTRKDIQNELEARGIEYSFSDLRKAEKCATMEEALAIFCVEETKEPSDLDEFQAYNSAVKQVKFWLNLRSQVGETSAAEDVISADDYNSSISQANEKIAAYREEAEKHLSGARRWARECRIQLEEV